VIVAVEGATASGKTTWCRTHHPGFVPENEGSDARWAAAIAHEQERGLAVCDTDPLKLHNQFGLYRLGAIDRLAWRREAARVRRWIGREKVGFADLVLVATVEEDELRRRRDADATRGRHRFDLHVRLGGPLQQWYEALDTLEPGHVLFGLPDELPAAKQRPSRFSVELFDLLIAAVGG
jgi:hypothetical protein